MDAFLYSWGLGVVLRQEAGGSAWVLGLSPPTACSHSRMQLNSKPRRRIKRPRRNSRILLHLEKNHVVPPSSQDVALCHYSVSGEVPL